MPTLALWSVGRRREQAKDIENLFEKIHTENFPNLVKETDMQA